MEFLPFKNAVNKQFSLMENETLFVTDVTKDELWEMYINSFPEGTNPIFRERTEHDCQCCKTFIINGGNVVSIDNKMNLISIWDIEVEEEAYQIVADAMSKFVKSKVITGIFTYFQNNLGTDHNHEMDNEDKIRRWNHFHFDLPDKFVHNGVGNPRMKSQEEKVLLERGLKEITIEAINTVLELIDQNSIYRGGEFRVGITNFKCLKVNADTVLPKYKDNYLWGISSKVGPAGRIKNTVIGTLLVDISEGMNLDKAVYRFEHKMDPERFKQPRSVITPGMIISAEKKVNELGFMSSLARRHAEIDDITINNVLFANRTAKKAMNVFDELQAETSMDIKKLKKVEEVSVDTFVNEILPRSEKVEVYFENKHQNNLMSLISPVDKDAKNMLKWDNNFSWTYNGEVADSIKERVLAAGGKVDALLRCSLSWFNYDDLDIHVREPDGVHIYFGNRGRHYSSGKLDVDMNTCGGRTRKAVENIVWTDKNRMPEGVYTVFVHQYNRREIEDIGFVVEMEYKGEVWTYQYDKPVAGNVGVIEFEFSRKNGIKIIKSLKSGNITEEVWGINTSSFHKASVIMNSPNHWDGEQTGNKHLFFVLEGCKNDQPVRGFFNEFLNEELTPHRKVFQMLGHRMKAEYSEKQLSGLGFSLTRRSSVICSVTGAFTRNIKINF